MSRKANLCPLHQHPRTSLKQFLKSSLSAASVPPEASLSLSPLRQLYFFSLPWLSSIHALPQLLLLSLVALQTYHILILSCSSFHNLISPTKLTSLYPHASCSSVYVFLSSVAPCSHLRLLLPLHLLPSPFPSLVFATDSITLYPYALCSFFLAASTFSPHHGFATFLESPYLHPYLHQPILFSLFHLLYTCTFQSSAVSHSVTIHSGQQRFSLFIQECELRFTWEGSIHSFPGRSYRSACFLVSFMRGRVNMSCFPGLAPYFCLDEAYLDGINVFILRCTFVGLEHALGAF